MAIYNLPNYKTADGFGMSLNIRRGNPNPLDNSSVWSSYEDALNYAQTSAIAYVGQLVTVVDFTEAVKDDETIVTPAQAKVDVYKIELGDDGVGKLTKVGAEEAQVAIEELEKTIDKITEDIAKLPTKDTNTTYTFTDGTEGKFTVTDSDKKSIEVNTGAKDYIDGKVEDLEGKISAIPKFAIEVVSELPTEKISNTTVYLVPDKNTKTSDVYDEYIYVNSSWELLGKQTLDLTGYATENFVSQAISDLSAEGGAIKQIADAHNELAEIVGDNTKGLAKDVADLKAIDHEKIAKDAADAADAAKQQAIAADVITSVNLDQHFVINNKQLGIAKGYNLLTDEDKAKLSKLALDGEDLTISASVNAANVVGLDNWIKDNRSKVDGLFSATDASKLSSIEANAQVNKLEGVKVNGVSLTITDKIVDIPAATADKFGVVKLGDEFQTNEDGALELKEVNIDKIVQDADSVVVLDGGSAADLL